MNLSTFNFKLIKNPIIQSLLVTLSLLAGYSLLGSFNALKSSGGFNQWQSNIIRLQKYAYQKHSQQTTVLVGSSLTANIPIDLTDKHIINLGLNGGCTQTGLEAVLRQDPKPKLLLVEINDTISRKVDKQVIESNYNPVLHPFRRYFPSFKEEYKPSTQIILKFDELRHKFKKTPQPLEQQNDGEKTDSQQLSGEHNSLGDKLISQLIQNNSKPLSDEGKRLLNQEAQYIKSQISRLERDGTHVILFNVPGDHRIENTLAVKQSKLLMKELFPPKSFNWISDPPTKEWLTGDGAHLTALDARVYADFLKGYLKSYMQL